MSAADDVRAALRRAADPARAAGQQAYMKSAMPYLGVTMPDVRRIARLAGKDLRSPDEARGLARALWDEATHREERYAGMILLGGPVLRGDLDSVPLLEHMVRTGRWWDFTDDLAGRVRELHDRHPVETARLVRDWSVDEDLWMRRLAILSQLGRRDRTDLALLSQLLEPNLGDPEFFIRKAIGWALRDVGRTRPDWVREYAATHELSPLSRREALKHL
ncbi:DNA alkylation repair protein [Microbacterium saccharophilum]|uniref:3-methyladenine DNA glycosylase AlkD n=1 Tax=Microbacterium saccharophilum TaxID=1213358 RepID=A0A5C8HV06_9MICO|nr:MULTISPECIES: DNA alkylation repair protein [Microbacterium]TXK09088.1 DNA alkylation repair protein [Microbacterium saccharophilum]GEP47748.1 DNA alkylation repair protein [Microbacterium saccharophilum]SFI33113.1 3-methyladenine DNA glycosylase AlkD [Microbacterium saccharophilum]